MLSLGFIFNIFYLQFFFFFVGVRPFCTMAATFLFRREGACACVGGSTYGCPSLCVCVFVNE